MYLQDPEGSPVAAGGSKCHIFVSFAEMGEALPPIGWLLDSEGEHSEHPMNAGARRDAAKACEARAGVYRIEGRRILRA